MFGDILTDLGAVIQGGIGISAGGNINPESISMFEPVHGSAPELKGQSIANPIGAILAGAMMLDNLGEVKLAQSVEDAVGEVLNEGKIRTIDLGGNDSTQVMGREISAKIKNHFK
jgi:3-isopropylmalate dehydrogenase